MNTAINQLPVRTWNWLGVNNAGENAALFVPQNSKASVVFGPLPAGVQQVQAPAQGVPQSGMGRKVDEFVLQHANTTCFVAVEGKAETPLLVEGFLDDAHPQLIAHNSIYAQKGSSVTLVEVSRSAPKTKGQFASLTQVYAARGAKVRLVQLVLTGDDCKSWNAVATTVEEGAKFELVRILLGSTVASAGARVNLAAQHGEFWLDQIYFGDTARSIDINDVAEHRGEDTLSEMHTAGVLAGNSTKLLRGTIDFQRGAVHAVGHESETVLLLSKTARNKTAPLILCGEEQVEGQHAATIGRLNQKQMYYLCSRGLTPAAARRLMVEAQFAPAVDKIPQEELQKEVLELVARRLDENEESFE